MIQPNKKELLILEVAEKLFAVKGYDATSIRDIAKDGSFNSAMIYYYFESKEQLLQAIFSYRIAQQDHLIHSLFLKASPLDNLFALLDFYIRELSHRRYFLLLLIQIHSFPSKFAAIDMSLKALKHKNYTLLELIINEGRQKGYFSPRASPGVFIAFILGLLSNVFFSDAFISDNPESKVQFQDNEDVDQDSAIDKAIVDGIRCFLLSGTGTF